MSTLFYTRQNRIIFVAGLTLFIILLLMLLPVGQSGVAESAAAPFSLTPYPGCIRDNHTAVEPLNFPNAWSLMLTFNHPESDTQTTACWAVRDQNLDIWYRAGIVCDLVGNTNNVKVGNGSANFDGNFHIQCPPRANTNFAQYNTFFVHADAAIPQAAGFYPLVKHPDFYVHIKRDQDVNQNWLGSIHSVMGGIPFEAYDKAATLSTDSMEFNSVVRNGDAYHRIAGQESTRISVNPFMVDMTNGIEIGGGAVPWTLNEIIIDPPAFCQSNC